MYSAEDLFTEDAEADLERIVEDGEDEQHGSADEMAEDGNGGNEGNDNNQGGDDNDGENQAGDAEGDKTVKPKRVRNPQPKLDADTLRKPRGLLCLESLFSRPKFRGRGYEEQDLNVLMKTYEYWCHRMFPKLPFDDCIAKLEKLGTKKPVQTYMNRIRLDMLTDSDERPDIIVDAPEEREDEEANNEDDPFDNLLPQPESNMPQSLEAEQWTDEQLRRLEENRQRAQMIKMVKLQKIQEKATSVLERSQTVPKTTQSISNSQLIHEFPDELDEVGGGPNSLSDLSASQSSSSTHLAQECNTHMDAQEVEAADINKCSQMSILNTNEDGNVAQQRSNVSEDVHGMEVDEVESSGKSQASNGFENNVQSGETEQWSEDQLKRLEENRKRAEQIRLERQRKNQEKTLGKILDINTENSCASLSEYTNEPQKELIRNNDGLVLESNLCASETTSLSEGNPELKSLNTQDSATEDNKHVDVEMIAQELDCQPKHSHVMEVHEMLPANVGDDHLTTTNIAMEDDTEVDVSQVENSKVVDVIPSNGGNISNKNDEENSEESTEIYNVDLDNSSAS